MGCCCVERNAGIRHCGVFLGDGGGGRGSVVALAGVKVWAYGAEEGVGAGAEAGVGAGRRLMGGGGDKGAGGG